MKAVTRHSNIRFRNTSKIQNVFLILLHRDWHDVNIEVDSYSSYSKKCTKLLLKNEIKNYLISSCSFISSDNPISIDQSASQTSIKVLLEESFFDSCSNTCFKCYNNGISAQQKNCYRNSISERQSAYTQQSKSNDVSQNFVNHLAIDNCGGTNSQSWIILHNGGCVNINNSNITNNICQDRVSDCLSSFCAIAYCFLEV